MNTETVIEVLNALASNNSGIILARHATAKGSFKNDAYKSGEVWSVVTNCYRAVCFCA